MNDIAGALAAETERVAAFLSGLTPEDWAKPTRCAPLTVRELAVHALRGAYRIIDTLSRPALEGEPERDGVSYFRYDAAAVGKGVVDRAMAESKDRAADADIAAEWNAMWDRAIAVARDHAADDPLISAVPGTIRLREFLRTRCVEVTIHAMDLRDAAGLGPDPTPDGLEAACDVLRGLLGKDLRPLGVDEVRFALTGTGREKLTDDERELLGSLGDRFPLLQ